MKETKARTRARTRKQLTLTLRLAVAALVVLLVAFLSPYVNPSQPPVEGALEVVYLDVGQANAALVSSEGRHMLIDGGNVADSSLLVSVLTRRGIDRLDYVIFSHTDEDHVGGLAGALSHADVGVCYGSADERNTKAFKSFKEYLARQGVSITVPSGTVEFAFGSATVTIWHIQDDPADPNDNELVVRIVNGGDSFLFTGDIDTGLERMFLDEAGSNAQSDVLLVPHHGSDTSSGYVFLREVYPRYSVISVGENTYGHPTDNVLSKYRDLGTTLLRTDTHGDITFISDKDGLRFTTQKTPYP